MAANCKDEMATAAARLVVPRLEPFAGKPSGGFDPQRRPFRSWYPWLTGPTSGPDPTSVSTTDGCVPADMTASAAGRPHGSDPQPRIPGTDAAMRRLR